MLSKRTIISLMMSVSFLLSNQLGAVSFTAAWQKTKSYLNVAYKEIKTRPIATFAALGLVVSFSGWYESYRLRKQQDGLGRLHIDNYDFLVSKLNKECQEQMFEANKNVNQYRLYGGFLSGKPLTLIPPESRLICSINWPNFSATFVKSITPVQGTFMAAIPRQKGSAFTISSGPIFSIPSIPFFRPLR